MSDAESVELDEVTLRGGWKLLCVAALHHCAQGLATEKNLLFQQRVSREMNKSLNQSTAVERWMGGGVGVITFEDACECLSVTPEVARKKMMEYARSRRRKRPDAAFIW